MSISSEEIRKRLSTGRDVFCTGLHQSARWFALKDASGGKGIHLIILPTKESAEFCTADLYNLIDGDKVYFIPDTGRGIEKSNYKSTLSVQRTSAIERLLGAKDGDILFFVSYPAALNEKIPDIENIRNNSTLIRKGDDTGYEKLIEKLLEYGFEKVDFVSGPGQYAVRGALIDVFSYSSNYPYRISFFGDEVEEIHSFDTNTQLSVNEESEIQIISDIVSKSGNTWAYIIDSLPASTVIWLDSSDMYSEESFFKGSSSYRRVFLDTPLSSGKDADIRFNISPQPVFNKNFELLTEDIRIKMENRYKVCLYGEKEQQLDRIRTILSKKLSVLPEFIKGSTFHAGFVDNEEKLCCYTEHQIFDRYHRIRLKRTVEAGEQLTINDLNAFRIGDYVVHIDYGVGIFGGLVRMRDDYGRVKEAVKITYKDGDVVFVSVHALNKISRYKPKDGEVPRIHRLGSKSWQTLKAGAKSRVKDIAKDLIRLYAKRKSSPGFAFSADSYLQEELESSFLYEDTPDQEIASAAIKRDMEDKCPMDRLICGDVGFGKTELAVRAAFKAASDGKQVAVLVPTTILALQHYNTFTSRLKDFPCSVDYVSRLRSAKETGEIKRKLSEGSIDILIGTHKILGGGFEFKDLGLLIIDEEQKFGVSAKEKLRQIRTSVDTLTLTATPIPRTLQFSLLGARDLSIINTPPPNRIPIQTAIILFDEKEMKEIINNELNRGGQIFFLHNKVEELDAIYEILHRFVPDMRICIAHGQMKSGELENRILDFMRGDYDMLLCTTIIENGLDIPNANTIIINQAHNFGLSDLHQLRGRVGRSNRKAYCYLVVPPLSVVSEDARKRLKAIEEFSELGSGFNIAMQDLDIRGAGNLLGAEQSGYIMEMGYEAYQKILAEAMEELGIETGTFNGDASSGKFICDCTVETDRQALIPDGYLDVASEKLRIYKQLDSMRSEKEINGFRSVLKDRFGPLPEELENLLYVVRIRNLGSKLGFEKIIIKNGILIMFFIGNPVSPYFKSDTFSKILERVSGTGAFALKQSESKLKLLAHGIDSLEKAWSAIYGLQ